MGQKRRHSSGAGSALHAGYRISTSISQWCLGLSSAPLTPCRVENLSAARRRTRTDAAMLSQSPIPRRSQTSPRSSLPTSRSLQRHQSPRRHRSRRQHKRIQHPRLPHPRLKPAPDVSTAASSGRQRQLVMRSINSCTPVRATLPMPRPASYLLQTDR